ncbi:Ig-like domain-containing protein [Pseudochelatococcus sp. B33]
MTTSNSGLLGITVLPNTTLNLLGGTEYDYNTPPAMVVGEVEGNVIIDDNGNGSDDAPEGSVVSLIKGTDGVDVEVPDEEGQSVDVGGIYGTLTISKNGDFTYVVNEDAGEHEGSTDTFTYTLQTLDGRTDTAELRITIGGSSEGASVESLVAFTLVAPDDGVLDDVGVDDSGNDFALDDGEVIDTPESVADTGETTDYRNGSAFALILDGEQNVGYQPDAGEPEISLPLVGIQTDHHLADIA